MRADRSPGYERVTLRAGAAHRRPAYATENFNRPLPFFIKEPNQGVVAIAELEKQAIFTTLCQVNGDKIQAAKLLGIGKTTLYRKLKEYGPGQQT